MTLDHEYQPTVTCHGSASGIVEDACERAPGICIGRVAATFTSGRGGLHRGRAGPSLQPDPLAGLEVDRQQPHGRAYQDHAIHRQRRAGWQHRDLLLGVESPLDIEQARFLGVTGQRHAVPRRQQRTRRRRNPVAGGIAPVHRPVTGMAAGPALCLADERRQPGETTAGGKRHRDILPGNANHVPTAGASLLQNRGGRRTIPRPQPRDGPHDRERGLEGNAAIDRRQPIKPGRRRQRLARLERLDRRQQCGPVSGGRVKPASGDGHDAGCVVGGDGLLE